MKDVFVGQPVSSGRQTVEVDNGQADREFTANNIENLEAANENIVDVQTLENIFTDRIAR